jgi:uncharacterized coiled-coil DUF342 family protein
MSTAVAPPLASLHKTPFIPEDVAESNYILKRNIGPGPYDFRINDVMPGWWLHNKGHNIKQMIEREELVPTTRPVPEHVIDAIKARSDAEESAKPVMKTASAALAELDVAKQQLDEANRRIEQLAQERTDFQQQLSASTRLLAELSQKNARFEAKFEQLDAERAQDKLAIDELRKGSDKKAKEKPAPTG